MRKVYVEVVTRLIIQMDEGIEVSEVLDEMNYNFASATNGADIVDMEITNYNIEDSK